MSISEEGQQHKTGRAQEVMQQVMDSELVDNTRQSHEFWETAAKISADKDLPISIANTEQILEMIKQQHKEKGIAYDPKKFENKTIDGFVTDKGIVMNVESKRARSFVIGHEITHTLEKSKHYGKLQEVLKNYAPDVWKAKFDERAGQYGGIYTDENYTKVIEKEVTGDMVGEFVFSDRKFVEHLSTQDQNLFQKIWDEIKYLAKVATAGSKEARELAKVQRVFEKAYREAAKASNETKYSIGEIVDENNKSYGIGVHLDSTLLDTLTPDERKAMVKERIKELGGEVFTAYDNNGNAVDITIAKPNAHFKNQNGKRRLVNNDLTTKYNNNELKQEAVVLIDELITTSKFQGTDPAKHSHGWLDNNGQNDWDVWTTYIQDKNNTIWEATLHIANTANGEKIIYDVVPTKKVGQSGKSDTSLLNESVAQNGEDVKHSLSDLEADDLAPVMSISDEGQKFKTGRGWNAPMSDMLYRPTDIAPVKENLTTVSKTENVAPVAEENTVTEMFPDEQTPAVDERMAEADDIAPVAENASTTEVVASAAGLYCGWFQRSVLGAKCILGE